MPNGKPDGSIIVDTQIDNKGLAAGSEELKKAIKSMSATVKSRFKDIKQSADNLNNTVISPQLDVTNIEQAEKEIVELEREIKRLNDKKASLESGKLGLGNYNKELAQLDVSTAEMMKDARTPQQRTNVEAIQSVEMDRLEEKYSGVISKQEQYNAKIKEAEARIQQLKSGIAAAQASEQAEANAAEKVASAQSRAATQATRKASAENSSANASKRNAKELSRGQVFANGLKNAFNKVHKTAGGLLGRLATMRKHTGAMHGNILKMGLAMLSIRSIWGAIRQVMNAALSSNQQLQNKLTAIKGVFGQAFLPIINTLISGLSYIVTLADRIYQIFSGVSLISKYNASQMKSTAGSTGAAAKSAKELKKQLAGFDELNVLNKNDTDSGSGGGGAGGGNIATFEPSKLSSKVKEFVDKLKELYKQGDFEGIGVLIGTAINKGLQKINDAIRWENLGGKITEFVTNFTTAFNSLVDTVDWELLGDTVAQGINTIVNTLYLLLTQIDFAKCGQALGQDLNGLLHGVDWKKLGMTVSAAFEAVLTYLINAVETFDWRGLGKAIADFIQGINWVKIIGDLARLIGDIVISLCDIVIGFVETVDWGKAASDLFDSIVAMFTNIKWDELVSSLCELIGSLLGAAIKFIVTWNEKKLTAFSEIAANIVDGFKNGINDELKQIGKWIVDHIFKPFIDGFKKAFGIHSPSTVMAEQGGYLIDGLKNGIGNVWNKVKEKFTAFWSSLKDYFKASGFNGLGSNIISGIKTGIGGVWSKLKEKFSAFWTSLKNYFKASGFNGLGSNIISGIKSGIGGVWSKLKEKFSSFRTSIKSFFSAENFKNLGNNIVSGIKRGINDKIGEIKTALTNGLSSALSAVKQLLGIHSPSRVFRDEVGQYIGLGIGEGISGSIPKVVDKAASLTDAVANQFNSNKFKLNGIGSIGDTLAAQLRSIGASVQFSYPTAMRALPYSMRGEITSKELWSIAEHLADDITYSNIQISREQTEELRRIISALDLTVNIDERAEADRVIKEIKRRTLITKQNPLLV